eukprot:1628359-Lingulodinium_polyedra.AAC.1
MGWGTPHGRSCLCGGCTAHVLVDQGAGGQHILFAVSCSKQTEAITDIFWNIACVRWGSIVVTC